MNDIYRRGWKLQIYTFAVLAEVDVYYILSSTRVGLGMARPTYEQMVGVPKNP